jgi:hypothetical protein
MSWQVAEGHRGPATEGPSNQLTYDRKLRQEEMIWLRL